MMTTVNAEGRCRTRTAADHEASATETKTPTKTKGSSPAETKTATRSVDLDAMAQHEGIHAQQESLKNNGKNLPSTAPIQAATPAAVGPREAAVRSTLAPMLKEMQGHGVDVDKFVQWYTKGPGASIPQKDLEAHTRFRFVNQAITNNPELTDKVVDMRLRHLSKDQQVVVRKALEQRGSTGLRKIADIEPVLKKLNLLGKEGTANVREAIQSGKSINVDTVIREEFVTQAIEKEELENFVELMPYRMIDATKSSNEEVMKLLKEAGTAFRQAHGPYRHAERLVGGKALLGQPGELGWAFAEGAATGSSEPIGKWAEDTGRYTGYVLGDGTAVHTQALHDFKKVSDTASRYEQARKGYEKAVHDNDYATANKLRDEMGAAKSQLKQDVDRLKQSSGASGRIDKQFDKDGKEVIIDTVVDAGTGQIAKAIPKGTKREVAELAMEGTKRAVKRAVEDDNLA